MFKFLTDGWAKFATGKMQFEDPNKNQLGKGTLQRFLESNFKELDDYSIDQLDNLIERVLDPTTCNVEYLKHFESLLGITVFPAFLVNDIRRKVITHAIFYYKKKATKLGISSLFNLIDSTCIITEVPNLASFDSPFTFDDVGRIFDSGKCAGCSTYSLAITQNGIVTTDNDYLIGGYSIIKFNHPIGAVLTSATIGGTEIHDLMLAAFVLQGGTASNITDNDGFYLFIQSGNIVKSTRLDGNLVVTNNQLSLNV